MTCTKIVLSSAQFDGLTYAEAQDAKAKAVKQLAGFDADEIAAAREKLDSDAAHDATLAAGQLGGITDMDIATQAAVRQLLCTKSCTD